MIEVIEGEKIIIEEMREEDLPEVVKIERSSFSDPWSFGMFEAELSNSFSHIWVVREQGGVVVGYVCFWLIGDEAHLLNLSVHPGYRRRGLGSGLLTAAIDYWGRKAVESAYLEVRESNETARRLYERFGFRTITRRVRYYRNPKEDACVMGLKLNER